jgi:FtsH-binding integral membrane protein
MKNNKFFWFLITLYGVTMVNLSWYKTTWYIIFSVLVAAVFVAYTIREFLKEQKETEKRIRGN